MRNQTILLGNEPIPKLLARLSVPATIGMMVNALYNLVDTVFVGRGAGELAIGGLTIAFPIQMLIMAIAQMIGIGAASYISRSLGAGEKENALHATGNSYILVTLLSTLFMTVGLAFTEPLLRLFGATDALLPYASDYIRVILMGSVFFSFTVSANNLVRSEGNAKISMQAMLIGTGLNIILDPFFIYSTVPVINAPGFGLGIQGAALATIISQFMSFIFLMRYLMSGNSALHIEWHHLKLKTKLVYEIFAIGMPAFVRQVGGSFLAIVLNNSLAYFGGDQALIIYGIINKITMFVFMPMFGIVQGFQPIAGFNYGAKNYERLKCVVSLSIKVLIVLATFGWAITFFFPSPLFKLFGASESIVNEGVSIMRIMFAGIPIVGIQIIASSYFQALGKVRPSFVLSLMRQLLILIPLILILPRIGGLGLLGIWIAVPISDILSTLISAIIFYNSMQHVKVELSV